MKEFLVKNIHWFIILYTCYNLFLIYDEKTLEVETQSRSTKNAELKLKKSKKDLAQIKEFNDNLEESRKRVQEVIKNIEKIQKQLPSEINDTEVQRIMSDIAGELRIQNPETNPKQEISQGFYFSKDYTFDSKGTYLQNLILFEKLEKLSSDGRILNIKYARMTVDDSADKRSRFRILKMSLIIESYRYNPSYKIGGPQ